MVYATTIQLANFMGLSRKIPDPTLVGSSRVKEEVGTGDTSTTIFWLDYGFVLDGSYTLSFGASEDNVTALVETTSYTIDKELGKITITAGGLTTIGTNNIYAAYSYIPIQITDAQLSDAIARAEKQIDKFTNNHFAVATDATPDWKQSLNEQQDGGGVFKRNYFNLNNYPLPDVSTTLNGAVAADDGTITLTSGTGFPDSGSILIGNDKIEYTGKSTNDLTGCTSVGAHDDGSTVKPYVVEISTTEPGGSITWDILTENTEFEIDRKTGRVHVYADGASYDGTYVDLETSPLIGVANRFRISYIYGNSTIPVDIVKATLMLAAKDLMSFAVRKAHTSGLNDFNPDLLDVDKDELNKILSSHRNDQSGRC